MRLLCRISTYNNVTVVCLSHKVTERLVFVPGTEAVLNVCSNDCMKSDGLIMRSQEECVKLFCQVCGRLASVTHHNKFANSIKCIHFKYFSQLKKIRSFTGLTDCRIKRQFDEDKEWNRYMWNIFHACKRGTLSF